MQQLELRLTNKMLCPTKTDLAKMMRCHRNELVAAAVAMQNNAPHHVQLVRVRNHEGVPMELKVPVNRIVELQCFLIRWSPRVPHEMDVDGNRNAFVRVADLCKNLDELMFLVHGRKLNRGEDVTGQLGNVKDYTLRKAWRAFATRVLGRTKVRCNRTGVEMTAAEFIVLAENKDVDPAERRDGDSLPRWVAVDGSDVEGQPGDGSPRRASAKGSPKKKPRTDAPAEAESDGYAARVFGMSCAGLYERAYPGR